MKKNSKKTAKKSTKASGKGAAPQSRFGIRPLADRVLVKEETKEELKKTDTGILVPEKGEKDTSSRRGEVIAVGPGRYGDDNELLPMTLKKGDKVLFQWGEKVTYQGSDYFVVREGDIIAVID